MKWKHFWKVDRYINGSKDILAHCLCCEMEMKGYLYFHLLCKVFYFFLLSEVFVKHWLKECFRTDVLLANCSSLQVNKTLNTVILLDRRVLQTLSLSVLLEFEYKLRDRICR